MLSPFFTVTVRSFQPLPPVVWAPVFGSSVMFSGTMRGLEAGVGIGRAVGGVGERRAAPGCGRLAT